MRNCVKQSQLELRRLRTTEKRIVVAGWALWTLPRTSRVILGISLQ